MYTQTTYHIRRILEYSEFFKGEDPLDIPSTLKLFNRNKLVRMAAIISLHYGNMHIPDNEKTLFSESSKKHITRINELFLSYYRRGLKVEPGGYAAISARSNSGLYLSCTSLL